MIHRVRIENYKALRDVTVELTSVHVLIGPNDSGKTSILEAVAALCRSVDYPLSQAFTGSWEGPQLVWRSQMDLPVIITGTADSEQGAFEYHLAVRFSRSRREVVIDEEMFRFSTDEQQYSFTNKGSSISTVFGLIHRNQSASDALIPMQRLVHNAYHVADVYRWDARLLALPVAPDSKRRFRMEPSGFGLALTLDDILGFDRDRFIALENRFRSIFPQIRSIKLVPEQAFRAAVDQPEQIPLLDRAEGKGLYFEFVEGGHLVPASQVSDGMLLVLAYLTVLHLPEPPRVMLVEEPENGIHPKRLKDVLGILRELVAEQSHTQIILTTHSPYVVDLFNPEEVTLCRRSADGSIAVRRLSESEVVLEQRDLFTLGEIWTAEGDEALNGAPVVAKDAGP